MYLLYIKSKIYNKNLLSANMNNLKNLESIYIYIYIYIYILSYEKIKF